MFRMVDVIAYGTQKGFGFSRQFSSQHQIIGKCLIYILDFDRFAQRSNVVGNRSLACLGLSIQRKPSVITNLYILGQK